MITKKLMHDIQTWLNSFYDFDDIFNYFENNKFIFKKLIQITYTY